MIEGYRGWNVKRINGQEYLFSPTQKEYCWHAGLNIAVDRVAYPDNGIDSCDIIEQPAVVTEHNRCGFYALTSPSNVYEYFGGDVELIGKVFLYGNVAQGSDGYRAEKAQVASILLPTISRFKPEVLDSLVNYYRIPLVTTTGSLRRMLEFQRNQEVKLRVAIRYGKPRRCTAGGRALASVRSDAFLL